MLRVDRATITIPNNLTSARAQLAFKQLRDFYDLPQGQRLQRSVPFEASIWGQARNTLKALFHGKCAFCESQLDTAAIGYIEHFRPKGGAKGEHGEYAPDHYWWLAYEWTNLYYSCQVCNFSKGSRFPVRQRAKLLATGDDLQREGRLLLDPCIDDPDVHLLFTDDGYVRGITLEGQATIDVFNLNREGLIRARARAIRDITVILPTSRSLPSSEEYELLFPPSLSEVLSLDQAYVTAKRQVLRRWIWERESKLRRTGKADLVDRLLAMTGLTAASPDPVSLSVTSAPSPDIETAQYITRIVVHNFRAIADLDLEFPRPQSEESAWLVLLGDNGIGKSSILQAVALTLMDDQQRGALDLDASSFVRTGQKHGSVAVHLSSDPAPCTLTFRRGKRTFTCTAPTHQTPALLGYSATRLPPRGEHRPPIESGRVRATHLFDPFLPLRDAPSWLMLLPRQPFGFCAKGIKDLLLSEEDAILRRRRGKDGRAIVRLQASGTMHATTDLSDGYQSMLALVVDIMATTRDIKSTQKEAWPRPEELEGIVLIDELDVHLHPRWKAEITTRLRRVFPRVQFIVTTHDPLVLLGTRSGEVRVMRRDEETKQVRVDQVDVPPGTSADGILTGSWFGLSSTLDPDTIDKLEQHRQMLRQERPAEDPMRRVLEQELRQRLGTFGDTSVERLTQSVVAKVIDDNYRELSPTDRSAIRDRVLAMVHERQAAKG